MLLRDLGCKLTQLHALVGARVTLAEDRREQFNLKVIQQAG